MIVRTNLLTKDTHVVSPEGIVYSTDPWRAEGENEISYFIKGPSLEIVFAEITGCELAKEVGLPVPDVAACGFAGEVFAGSASVEDAIRDIEPWLNRPHNVSNPNDLFCAVIVDIWLANKDRNMGNVLGRPQGSDVEYVFIDFEKSVALRPQPSVSSTMLQARELWPSGELGRELSARKPLHPPVDMIERIGAITTERCHQIVDQVIGAIGAQIAWGDDTIHAVMQRAKKIQQLAEAVWATN